MKLSKQSQTGTEQKDEKGMILSPPLDTPLYTFPPLLEGRLVKRYKRFFADVELADGSLVTAHCPNTGPMTGVSTIGAPVLLSKSDNPNRKLAYTWELIQVDETWVGINTNLPNKIIGLGLERRVFSELGEYVKIEREVPYGSQKSRIDYRLTRAGGQQVYLEIKNTTWTDGKSNPRTALFPDTVTTRGQKHLEELIEVVQSGQESVLIFFINRQDCERFAPGAQADPRYGKLFLQALEAGVKILPYRFQPTAVGVHYMGLAELA
jgi:sugar fermentation stimulation protein A